MCGIVVGVDGSDHSQRALEWAAREAVAHGLPLSVLTVHQAPVRAWGTTTPMVQMPDVPGAGEELQAQAQQQATRDIADKALSSLGEDRPPKTDVQVVTGLPADELIRASADADLLVVGTRGSGGFARLLLGSVSTQVVHHAHCPVVVVPPGVRPG